MKSPFDISYNDLIDFAEDQVLMREQFIIKSRHNGEIPGTKAEKRLQVLKEEMRIITEPHESY